MNYIIVFLVLTSIPYLIIGLIMLVYGMKQNLQKNYAYKPSVTIFIPTRNEESQIGGKLENLLAQTYPITEILVIDSSTDDTPRIVEKYQKEHPLIKLIRRPKETTMVKKVNGAFELAKGEIIVKTDCDSRARSEDALKELIANFSNSKIGGACGICTSQKDTEKYFRKIMTWIQAAETELDSTIIAHSTSLLAFRKAATIPLGSHVIADDVHEFILLRKKGYRTIADMKVLSEEELPDTFKAKRLWRDRRAQGIIKALIENKDVLFNPRYGKYGLIVYPMCIFTLVISPFLLTLNATLVVFLLSASKPAYLLIFIAVGVLIFLLKPSMVLAIIDAQLGGLNGTIRTLLGKVPSPTWEKIE